MIDGYVEPSGESPDLARAEIAGAVRALGGDVAAKPGMAPAGLIHVRLADVDGLRRLAGRLALARRVLVGVEGGPSLERAARRAGAGGGAAVFRRLGRPSGPADAAVLSAGRAYVDGGGSVNLERPARRFWIARDRAGSEVLLEEAGEVPRREFGARAMPRLPFRRPVSLPPRLARAAANLASVRAGDRILDPFLGTGALLAEAALLGAEVFGIDRDPAMIRGALENFGHLGTRAAGLAQGDAREVDLSLEEGLEFDAIVTDPPYGRSSAPGGSLPERLAREVLGRWSDRLVPGGTVVVVLPGGPSPLAPSWREELRVPVRVHRSLTREFRRYARGG